MAQVAIFSASASRRLRRPPARDAALLALLRGSVFGARRRLRAGLLLDTATLGTLGVTSLLLTLAGFWIGRYGETTARDRAHAPFLAVGVVTVLYALGASRCIPARRAAPARWCSSTRCSRHRLLTCPHAAASTRSAAGCFPPAERSTAIHEVRAPWLAAAAPGGRLPARPTRASRSRTA